MSQSVSQVRIFTVHQRLTSSMTVEFSLNIGVNVQLGSWHWRSQCHRRCCICPAIHSQLQRNANYKASVGKSVTNCNDKSVDFVTAQLSTVAANPLWHAPQQQNLKIEAVTLGQHCQLSDSDAIDNNWNDDMTVQHFSKTLTFNGFFMTFNVLFFQNLPHKVNGLSNGLVQPKYRTSSK